MYVNMIHLKYTIGIATILILRQSIFSSSFANISIEFLYYTSNFLSLSCLAPSTSAALRLNRAILVLSNINNSVLIILLELIIRTYLRNIGFNSKCSLASLKCNINTAFYLAIYQLYMHSNSALALAMQKTYCKNVYKI